MSMYCRQCEQTVGGIGCTVAGVCGKDTKTSNLQDVLVSVLQGISAFAYEARKVGVVDKSVDAFVVNGLFTTVTNVNFDSQDIKKLVEEAVLVRERIKIALFKAYKSKYSKEFDGQLGDAAVFMPDYNIETYLPFLQGNEDIKSLKELVLYGIKGMAAYASHASILGKSDEKVDFFFHKALYLISRNDISDDELTALVFETGEINLKCMELLDAAHNDHYGAPVPTKVPTGFKKGPAIVVSGHDLHDLDELLEQTKDKGINVYTHGEMLPAHGYPGLKKYKHLAGNYGSAWQNQQKEFDNIPAAVLMTTNCIQKPLNSYKDNIFTTGLVKWPGVEHIQSVNGKKDYSPVINKALTLGGFKQDKAEREILVGFGHKSVLAAAPKLLDAISKGTVKHIFLIGGCDGAKPGRNYYTEFAQLVPQDCLILTLACGKFRFNNLEFGNIGEFPRLLDMGQCNDAYSAIKVAVELSKALNTDVNSLPLSLILSWYEQKAVCILLTLLYLGLKNMRIGPTLPAFVSSNVLKMLVEKFNIKPITTPAQDLMDILPAQFLKQ